MDFVLMTSSTMKLGGMRMVMVVRPDPSGSLPLPAFDEDWPVTPASFSGGAKWIGIASIPPSAFCLASLGGVSTKTYDDLVRLPATPSAAAAFLLAARAAAAIIEVFFEAEPAKRRKRVRIARLGILKKGKTF